MTTESPYRDLNALSEHACMGKSTLRAYMRHGGMPYYKVKGKVLVKLSEFDQWMEQFRETGVNLNAIVDEVMESLEHKE